MTTESKTTPDRTEPGPGRESPDGAPADRGAGLPAAWNAARGHPAPGPDAPDGSSGLRALRRRWAPASALGVLASMAAGLATWAFMPPPKFAAEATLFAASAPPHVLSPSGGGRADFATYVKTQAGLIRSRLVLNRLLAEPGIAALPLLREAGDPLGWLQRELKVESGGGSELIRVSLAGNHAEDLARVVNEILAIYLREVREQEVREKSERLRQLKENLDRCLADRSGRREAMKKYSEQIGASDRRSVSVRQELDLERLELSRRELLHLQSDLRRAHVEQGVIEALGRAGSGPAAPAGAVAVELAADPVIGSHSARIGELEGRLASARRSIRGEDDPAIGRVRDELESSRKALAARRGEVAEAAGRRTGEQATREVAGRIAAGREKVAILEEHERILAGEVARLAGEARASNRTGIALEHTRGEMDLADEMVKNLTSEIHAQGVERIAPPRVRMLEKAEVPTGRDPKPRLKATSAAAGGAFALILLGFTWIESRAGRIDSARLVRQQLNLRLLGVLPRLGDRFRGTVLRPDTAGSARHASLYFESVDATQAMILRVLDDGRPRIVLIASALKAEGKTSLSCHLAASLARAGKATLLVDGDLRIPSAHRLLGLPAGPGLSEVLRGDLDLADAVRPSAIDGLMFLPAGECDDATLDAMSRGKVGRAFAELRGRFEFILVDSPPILPVADAILLGRHCDAVILSILENASTIPATRAALDRLGSLDVPVMGAVVAGSVMPRYKYRGYRKVPTRPRHGRPVAGVLPGRSLMPASTSPPAHPAGE